MSDASYERLIQHCFERILATIKRPLLIAITGDSGSGKSHFSQLLREKFDKEYIPYSYIDFDEFLFPRKDREYLKTQVYTDGPFKGKTHYELLENFFDLEKFENAIADLKSSRPATYFPYERATGEISSKEKTVPANNFVLFDTSLMTEKMDFIILVEVDRETIIQRKIKRDSDLRTPEQVREMHEKVQGFFWDRKKPTNPDIIIDNNTIGKPFLRIK